MDLRLTLNSACDIYLDAKKLVRPKTHKIYRYCLDSARTAAGKIGLLDTDISEITSNDLIRLVLVLDEKQISKNMGENTIGKIVSRVKAVFSWLQQTKLIDFNPAASLDYRRTYPEHTKPFRPEEVNAILTLLVASRQKSEACLRDTAIFNLLADTGLRANEVCSLRMRDVRDTTIYVLGKAGKRRMVSIGSFTRSLLDEYINLNKSHNPDDSPFFTTQDGESLRPEHLSHRLTFWAKKAGVANAALHRFRATFAVRFIQLGGDPLRLQVLLGHSDLTMTFIYSRMAYEEESCWQNSQNSIVDAIFDPTNQQPEASESPIKMQSNLSLDNSNQATLLKLLEQNILLINRILNSNQQAINTPVIPGCASCSPDNNLRQTHHNMGNFLSSTTRVPGSDQFMRRPYHRR